MAQIDVELGAYNDDRNHYGVTIDDVALKLVGGWANCGVVDPITLSVRLMDAQTGVPIDPPILVVVGDQTGLRRKNIPTGQRPTITWDAARQRIGGIEIQAT